MQTMFDDVHVVSKNGAAFRRLSETNCFDTFSEFCTTLSNN